MYTNIKIVPPFKILALELILYIYTIRLSDLTHFFKYFLYV